jgi:hypothetical protein
VKISNIYFSELENLIIEGISFEIKKDKFSEEDRLYLIFEKIGKVEFRKTKWLDSVFLYKRVTILLIDVKSVLIEDSDFDCSFDFDFSGSRDFEVLEIRNSIFRKKEVERTGLFYFK